MLYFIITLSALLIGSKAQDCGGLCPTQSAIVGVELVCNVATNACEPGTCAGDGDCMSADYPSCNPLIGCIDPCTSNSECQTRASSQGATDVSNIVCYTEFGVCGEDTSGGIDFTVNVTACIGICEAESLEAGVDLVCNETTGWCDVVSCDGNADCTNGDYSTCVTVFDQSACIAACSSDAECQQRATDSGILMADNYYCITGVGICEEGASCTSSTDCIFNLNPVCDGGVCKEDFCTMDSECDTNYVCAVGLYSDDFGICSAEFCREDGGDAACAANLGDDFICIVGVSPEAPADLGVCTNEFCREGTCGEGTGCITGIGALLALEQPGLTIPDDVGVCVDRACEMDADCADIYGLNDTFICASGLIPFLPETAGTCINDLCKEGTCGMRGVCAVGVTPPDMDFDGLPVVIPDDIGVCIPGGCYDNIDCAEQLNDTFVCVVGFFALLNETQAMDLDIPNDLGFCSNEFCSEEVDNCMEGENCAIGIIPPLPDYGQCIEPQCSMDADCNGTATCLDTAIGGVCIVGCDTEGEVCTDENGMDATCKVFPADSVFCGVPLENTLACSMDEPGESLVCTQSPTPMPTDEPTPMPTTAAPTPRPTTAAPTEAMAMNTTMEDDGSGGGGSGNGAERVLLFGVMAVIAGALASM